MNGPCKQFFARTGFAEKHHGGGCACCHFCRVNGISKNRIFPNNPLKCNGGTVKLLVFAWQRHGCNCIGQGMIIPDKTDGSDQFAFIKDGHYIVDGVCKFSHSCAVINGFINNGFLFCQALHDNTGIIIKIIDICNFT